jgi:DNA polymerase (family 10)
MLENQEIARVFSEIADMLAIQGEMARRINAYRRAADSISTLSRNVADVAREGTLTDIPGIGKVLAAKIDEYLATGTMEFYERIQAEVPAGVVEMLRIPDVGPKTASRVWKELGVTTIEELEAAAREGRVQQLSRMGARTEEKILEGIESMRRWRGSRGTRPMTCWLPCARSPAWFRPLQRAACGACGRRSATLTCWWRPPIRSR